MRKIRIPDEATVEIDLRQEQNVEVILRKLSRYGAIAIEDVTSVLPQHSSEITTNENVSLILSRARRRGKYEVTGYEERHSTNDCSGWFGSSDWEKLSEGDNLQAIFCCHLRGRREAEYVFDFQPPHPIVKSMVLNGTDIILITGATRWRMPWLKNRSSEPSMPAEALVRLSMIEVRYVWKDITAKSY
ncbi:hypothetical protein PISL3812_09933 [Talaromyces islandicus]|uniref:Uncharacterized protein n=1 Tax=Talaromyces islandicus TaxID=28573 RepID=A0A0U1MCW7_TALIS|nr:hypothetical protein PISL3812_09933 [Talaromyces islandicus]